MIRLDQTFRPRQQEVKELLARRTHAQTGNSAPA
jgi:hypothetical protein